jgi:hypothetical protein
MIKILPSTYVIVLYTRENDILYIFIDVINSGTEYIISSIHIQMNPNDLCSEVKVSVIVLADEKSNVSL